MNYTHAELDARLDGCAAGWRLSFHCNGDVGLDAVVDSYEACLARHGLAGTDHRWRVEHCGAGRRDQFARAAGLGVHDARSRRSSSSTGVTSSTGSSSPRRWARGGSASPTRGRPVSTPRCTTTAPCRSPGAAARRPGGGRRATPAARSTGDPALTMDQALRAHTIHGARALRRGHDLGSIEVGKLADLVLLSADPTAVNPHALTDMCRSGDVGRASGSTCGRSWTRWRRSTRRPTRPGHHRRPRCC